MITNAYERCHTCQTPASIAARPALGAGGVGGRKLTTLAGFFIVSPTLSLHVSLVLIIIII